MKAFNTLLILALLLFNVYAFDFKGTVYGTYGENMVTRPGEYRGTTPTIQVNPDFRNVYIPGYGDYRIERRPPF